MAFGSPSHTDIGVSMVLEIAVVESLFLALDETRDGCFNTSCGIKIIVPFFTTRLCEC